MKFEYQKSTDVTEFAHQNNVLNENGIIKVFVMPDRNDVFIMCIFENTGDDYETVKDSYLVELSLQTTSIEDDLQLISDEKLLSLLKENDSNEYKEYQIAEDYEHAIAIVDEGYGFTD